MLACGPMALTAMLLIQASAEIETGARLEARVGEFPTGGNSEASVMAVVTPRLRLDWLAGTDTLSADMSSRILWRPVPLHNQRPLFLETLVLEHTARLTRRSEWRLGLQASYGEQDYTSLSQQLENQPTLPISTTMVMASGSGGLRWRASRRASVSVGLGATHRRTIGAGGRESGAFYTLPTQTTVSATPSLQFGLNRRLVVEASVPVTDYDIQQNSSGAVPGARLNIVAVQPQLSASEQVTRHHSLSAVAGVTYTKQVRAGATNLGDRVSPLGQLGLASDLYRTRSTILRSTVSTGITWFMDPVFGTGRLRAVTSVGASGQLGPRWSTAVGASFVTDISKPPATTSTPVDGTLFSANCSLSYRWPRVLSAQLGGRFSERGPRLASSGFEWRSRELWAFLSLYAGARGTLTGVRPSRNVSGM